MGDGSHENVSAKNMGDVSHPCVLHTRTLDNWREMTVEEWHDPSNPPAHPNDDVHEHDGNAVAPSVAVCCADRLAHVAESYTGARRVVVVPASNNWYETSVSPAAHDKATGYS